MAIEIIPKEAKKLPFWQNILFYFSIVLLLAILSGFLILNFFEKKSLKTLADLKTKLEMGMTAEAIQKEKEILSYQKKIDDFLLIFAQYKTPSKFFPLLEKITHPKAFFSRLSLETKEAKAFLSGQTESFETLGQQILIFQKFQKEEKIKDFRLTEMRVGKEGKIEFSFEIFLDPKIFQ